MSNSRLRKLLLPLLRGYVAGKPRTFARMETARQAIYLIEKPVSPKSKSGRLRREQKRATHKEETAKIREEVFKRANGLCELDVVEPHGADELHHLEGGSGRTALQAVSNCVAACRNCHRTFHRHPEAYRARILFWAAQHGYPIPRRYRGEPKAVA